MIFICGNKLRGNMELLNYEITKKKIMTGTRKAIDNLKKENLIKGEGLVIYESGKVKIIYPKKKTRE